MTVPNQFIPVPSSNINLWIKREDLSHPTIPGNKFRKLRYNLIEAQRQRAKAILTFGGAFSNHIAAVAQAGKESGIPTIGIIRGEELANTPLNPTLTDAQQNGMQLEFINREDYRIKDHPLFLESLKSRFGDFYLLPEGGSNGLAVKGCEEILTSADEVFDYICCAVGTGGTLSGLVNSTKAHQKVLGFSSMKGTFDDSLIRKFARNDRWEVVTGYDFGGYAKMTAELVDFINYFRSENKIPLDPVYTGKMMFGLLHGIASGKFPENARILAIHTGGLQGIEGMNLKLQKQNIQLIDHD